MEKSFKSKRFGPVGMTLLTFLLASSWLDTFRTTAQTQKAATILAPAAGKKQLERGKELFMAHCASCHNERGDKALDKGLPLNQRALADEVIRKKRGTSV